MPVSVSIAAAAVAAVLVLVLVVACVVASRRRDRVGRAVAGHTLVLSALRNSASRAAKAQREVP